MIAGTKGGIGKTLIATFLADIASEHGFRPVLFDCDNENHSLSNACGGVPEFELADIDPESAEETEKRLDALDEKIAVIADKIRNEEKGDFNAEKGSFYKLNTALLYPIYEKFGGRKTKFSASDDCVNCGLCESICPVSAIKIENGKPVWTKEKCDMCLGCLSRCPKNAISIKKSLKNGRYVNPRVKF